MSFSSEIKQELSKINNLKDKQQVKYELLGYLISSNPKILSRNKIKYSTENEYNINRFTKLLSNLNLNYEIEIEGKLFVVTLNTKDIDLIKIEDEKIKINSKLINPESIENQRIEDKKSIIRGAFLGSGSINNPEKKYHLEINFSNKENLEYIKDILQGLEINLKILENTNKYAIYLKEGEEISSFLALMGATKGMLNFEEIRVKKEMRGKVNRLVNCQTANLSKTINASIEQVEAIRKLKEKGKFNNLNDNLKEIANLRLENPNMNLIELGELLKKPIGKSGVNYRLKKIIELAKDC